MEKIKLTQKDWSRSKKIIVNDAYQKGYYDKEMNRRATWNYFDSRYKCYFSNFKFGQTK